MFGGQVSGDDRVSLILPLGPSALQVAKLKGSSARRRCPRHRSTAILCSRARARCGVGTGRAAQQQYQPRRLQVRHGRDTLQGETVRPGLKREGGSEPARSKPALPPARPRSRGWRSVAPGHKALPLCACSRAPSRAESPNWAKELRVSVVALEHRQLGQG